MLNVPDIVALVGGAVGAIAMVLQALAARNSGRIQAAATAIQGYEAFCANLTNRINDLTVHIRQNEERIEQLERELRESRDENARLKLQIEQLQRENVALREEVAVLKAGQAASTRKGRGA